VAFDGRIGVVGQQRGAYSPAARLPIASHGGSGGSADGAPRRKRGPWPRTATRPDDTVQLAAGKQEPHNPANGGDMGPAAGDGEAPCPDCRYRSAAAPNSAEPRCPDCAGEARAATAASVRFWTFSFLMMLCTCAFTVLIDIPSR
jgi:hypothetical protein